MKKIITLTLVAIMAFLLTGCKKDNKQEEFSLVGTTYATTTTVVGLYESWRFFSDSEVEASTRSDAPNGEIIGGFDYGTYILDYPKLLVKIQNGSSLLTYECDFISETCFRTELNVGINKRTFEFVRQ